MSDPTIPPPAPRPSGPVDPVDVKPTVLQSVLTFVGGVVLAAGSCAGFLATLDLNREKTVNIVFALGFFASLLAALVGVVLIIVRQVRLVRRKRSVRAHGPGADPGAPAAPSAGPSVPSAGAGVIERGSAWTALVVAGVLLAAGIGFVVLLVATDASPVAFLFLALAAASLLGSVLSLVVAAIRYARGR